MFKEKDKKGHFLAGATIYFVVGALASIVVIPEMAAFIGLVASIMAGAWKEIDDGFYPDKHTVDKMDLVATILGGLAAAWTTMIVWGVLKVL